MFTKSKTQIKCLYLLECPPLLIKLLWCTYNFDWAKMASKMQPIAPDLKKKPWWPIYHMSLCYICNYLDSCNVNVN